MAVLTGDAIEKAVRAGNVAIDPFDPANVSINSVDLTLSNRLLTYVGGVLDSRADNPVEELIIPPEGLVLTPGRGYLGGTVERCGSDRYVCYVDGRSSVGRLFLCVHCTAGRGDLGFGTTPGDQWTLEIYCATDLPVKVYPGMRICQATFHTVEGDVTRLYRGKYSAQQGACASRMWRDFLLQPAASGDGDAR